MHKRQQLVSAIHADLQGDWARLERVFLQLEKDGITVGRCLDDCPCCAAGELNDLLEQCGRSPREFVYYRHREEEQAQLSLHCGNADEMQHNAFSSDLWILEESPTAEATRKVVLEALSVGGLQARPEGDDAILVDGTWRPEPYIDWE